MFIGSDANGYGKNYIAFYGTTGDQPGEYTHTYIGENLWGGTESSELVLFKGNDIASQVNTVSNSGGDRIRHIAAGHLFQIYNSALSGTFQDICQSTTPINVFEINKQGIMVTMQNDATFKVYANTNTSYGYETVSLQTAFDAKDPETSGYPASYGHRCTMLLQPLGGQVYIGSNLTTLADSNYKLYVNGNTNIQGQLKIYTNTLFAYDNTDQYLQYTGESYVDSHAGRIDLYKIIASGTAGVAGTKTETISLRAATGDIYASGSIRNLSTSGGIYWSPYVESATDASDAASIYLIKSGAAGGTELRISIANDATDIINLHTPKFIYINEKKVFTVNDTWLRINEDSGYSSGICTGTSLVRSDNALQVGENGSHFYANSSGNGYIQNTFGVHGTDTTKHFFVNGTSRFADDITMDNGSEILFSTNTQYLRWTTNTGDNNSTGRSWYGIGTYQNTSDSNNSWLNISNYWGINITTKGNTCLRHNNNVITTTGNQTGTVGSGTHPIYSSGGVLMASSSTVGSGVRGIYLNAGAITPMSYELKATVNSGTANRVSYYNGSNQISSANGLYTTGGNLGINATTTTANSINHVLYVNGSSYFTNYLQTTSYFKSTMATGTAPIQVTSTTLNTNLNADLLDGYHESSFLRYRDAVSGSGGTSHSNSLWSQIGIRQYNCVLPDAMEDNATYTYGAVISLPGTNSRLDIWYNHQTSTNGNGLRYRTGWDNDKRAWVTILDTVNYTGALDGHYVKKSGDTMTGNLTLPSLNTAFKFNNSDIPEGAANLASSATAHTMTLYRNGITIPYQMDNTNDGGMIRVRENSESNCILELGTWDDSGVGETIQFNYYPTTSQVTPTYSVTVPKKSGTIALVGDSDSGFVKKSGDTMTGTLSNSAVKGGTWITGTHECTFFSKNATTASAGLYYQGHYGLKTPSGAWSLGILSGSDDLYFVYGTDANYTSGTNTSNTTVHIASNGGIYGAVWNDYAEFRWSKQKNIKSGHVVIETGKGDLVLSSKRMQPGGNIVSDTYGFAIGETKKCKTPIAVSGRVLAYPYEDRYSYSAGDPVCSGPNGTISKMTREEVREYPDRIIGTVSEIPEYETWGTGNVKVDGRIWIKVR